jgi:glutathione S-transferase
MSLRWLPGFLRTRRRSLSAQQQIALEARDLALYHMPLCSYCHRVRRALWWLNLPLELRNADEERWGEELRRQGGKLQVPCLRIRHEERVEWLYESTDIIAYLKRRFGR